MNYKIVSSKVLVEWNDNPKMVTSHHDMPDDLAQLFDEWLTGIENERNAVGDR